MVEMRDWEFDIGGRDLENLGPEDVGGVEKERREGVDDEGRRGDFLIEGIRVRRGREEGDRKAIDIRGAISNVMIVNRTRNWWGISWRFLQRGWGRDKPFIWSDRGCNKWLETRSKSQHQGITVKF